MRRQLTLVMAAVVSLVVVAFLIPLGYLVRQSARADAVAQGAAQAQAFAPLVGAASDDELTAALQDGKGVGEPGFAVSVFLSDGTVLGRDGPDDQPVLTLVESGKLRSRPYRAGLR